MERLFRRLRRRKETGETTPLEELPIEVKRNITSYLSIRDILNLSETSKRELDIVVVSSPLTDRAFKKKAFQNKAFQTDDTTQCFAAVIPNHEKSYSHPTTFACDVVTQFIDGMIWVVEQDLPANQSKNILKSPPFRSGKCVAKTMMLSSEKVNLSFFPKTGKFYQLWVNTRGDDSQLYLNNMTLHQVGLAMKPSRHAAFQFEVPLKKTYSKWAR